MLSKIIPSLLASLVSITLSAQLLPAATPVYNSAYMECEQLYTDLTRKVKTATQKNNLFLYNNQPFTGCAKQDHPDHHTYFLYKIENGIVQQELGYFYNGMLSREFNFKNGKSHGRHAMYYDNGNKYIEEYYNEGKPIDTHRRWYNNNRLAREVKYNNGKIVYEYLYDKMGNRKN